MDADDNMVDSFGLTIDTEQQQMSGTDSCEEVSRHSTTVVTQSLESLNMHDSVSESAAGIGSFQQISQQSFLVGTQTLTRDQKQNHCQQHAELNQETLGCMDLAADADGLIAMDLCSPSDDSSAQRQGGNARGNVLIGA